MKPLVSIIIPFYENTELLKKAIKSVFNQKFKNYELIIVNDKKDILNINFLKKIKKKSKKIKIIYNSKNIGVGKSRNKAIKLSKGKYIAFLDSDDQWKKNKLSEQIKTMEDNKYLATHTSYRIVDLKNKNLSKRIAKNLDYAKLLKSCDIGLSTVVLSKKIINNFSNPFPPLKTKEDYVLWLKIAKKGIIFYGINKTLTIWTNTPNSLSKSIYQKMKDALKVYMFYQNMNFIKSIYYTFVLSINYLLKK